MRGDKTLLDALIPIHETLQAMDGSDLKAVLLAVTLLVSVWHMQMGLKVIVDDYIHKPGSRGALLGLIGLFCLVIAAAGVFFIVRLALGSAPLPAGFGI